MKKKGQTSMLANAASGVCAGTVEAMIAVVPSENVRLAMTTRTGGTNIPQGPISTMCDMYKNHGVTRFFRGYGATAFKQGGNQGLRMAFQPVYASMVSNVWNYDDVAANSKPSKKKSKNPLVEGIAGTLAGVTSTVATQPFDCIKTKQQTPGCARQSMMKTACTMYETYGMKCFWTGTPARAFRVGTATGIHFATVSILTAALQTDYSFSVGSIDPQIRAAVCPVEYFHDPDPWRPIVM